MLASPARDVLVRAARVADARGIARVHVSSWRSAYRGLLPDAYLAALSLDDRTRRWRGRLRDIRASETVLVAERAGEVVGYASAGPTRDADCDASAIGELYALYVVEEAWGRGAGRLLHDAALDFLHVRAFSAATLWVLETNRRARRFYERVGWVADGSTKVEEYGASVVELRYRLGLF